MTFYFVTGTIVVVGIIIFLFILFYVEEKKEKVAEKEVKEKFKQLHNDLTSTKIVGNMDLVYFGLKNIDISHDIVKKIKHMFHEHIVGMDELINGMLISLLAGGHVLVEGVPGLAKTKTIHIFADLLGLDFKRIQFTPDMLPSDLTGVEIFNSLSRDFEVKLGPIVSHIVLADEINRTTPKVQSALLEAMQEEQISMGGKTHKLPQPFMVLATQNPIEQEGTYPLPEAQVDRFICKLRVTYPTVAQEKMMLTMLESEKKLLKKDVVISHEDLMTMKKEVLSVTINDDIKDYITQIVYQTRSKDYSHYIRYGASPRGSIALMNTAKAVAYLQGRNYVTHDDVLTMLLPTLRHRLILTYDAKAEGVDEDEILTTIIQ